MKRAAMLSLLLVFATGLATVVTSVDAQEPTFTSNTSLVIIDATVKDRSGKVLSDLKKSDFTVLEDGKPQQISVFEFQKLEGDVALTPVPAIKPAGTAPPAPPRPKAPVTPPCAMPPRSAVGPP